MNSGFEFIPAIDLKEGKCVRLQEGMASRSIEYDDDPVAVALHWQEQGASRLHVVDLSGAFSGQASHLDLIHSMLRQLRIPVQVGGGLRSLEQISSILDFGAERAILGTVAVEKPELVAEAVKRFADAIAVGVDAREGRVTLRGWTGQSGITASQLARRMKELGVARIIFTDVSRDGMLRGLNIEETERLARETGIPVIASGGASGVEDVRALWERRQCGIEGVILGRSLYENRINFRDLLIQASTWS
jgi:phosphoribosylformimino-5-aminoimidazole carboxamide ribotide isomerase